MRSSFNGLNIGLSGLYTAQAGLAVTGNNISNAANDGYSRQVLHQQASLALPGAGQGMYGTGVTVTGVERVRDSYLDVKMWGQNPTLGEYRVKTSQNLLLESVFGEPSDSGFVKVYGDMFDAISDLANMPTEAERSEVFKQNLISFTQYYNQAATSLNNFRQDLNYELKLVVDEINLLTSRIQSLNKQIYEMEIHGGTANALRDERDLAVDRLSQLINVEAEEIERTDANGNVQKEFVVVAGGYELVSHTNRKELDLVVDPDNDNMYKIQIDDRDFKMDDPNLSGELKGIIDMRDGQGTGEGNTTGITYNGIPYYLDTLDTFVQEFADAMNAIYSVDANGDLVYDEDGNPYYLFTDENGDPTNITAENFQIDPRILEDTKYIRTSYEHRPPEENPNPSNNDLLLDLLAVKDQDNVVQGGKATDYMIAMFSVLGINTKEAIMYEQSQTNIVMAIDLQRLSVSQVDTNEEFMHLIKYNQAYQAAARVISTMDEIYDTMINRIGKW